MRILNVAEKNDAAKGLAAIMSRGQSRKREGFSKFNKIYEFNCNILNTNAQMVMTSVSGHMMTLDFAQGYKKWNSCSPLQLFSAPVVKHVGEDYQKIKRTLEREVRGSQALIIWTDCDREGENIGFEIINVCKQICPRITLYRAKFSEITPQSVGRACANLVPPDHLQAEAVDVRMELDLRIGAAFTRFQTLRLCKVFPNVLSDQLISYGSCQFPTLGFVVDRYKQVEQFVPEQFFKIKVTHEVESNKVDFVWKRGRLYQHTPCLILYQMCLENPTAVVIGTSSRPKNKWRPVALDTVELEKLSSRKLRINAKETMKIAEKLYNKGFISYPRTETNIFPSSLNLTELVEKQTQDQQWGGFAAGVLAHGPNPRNGRKTDNAHPPIHPTKYTDSLQGNEKRIYEFIVRHFLACCSKDAVGKETSVDIDIAGEKFTATGLMILERNYLEVYPYDRWSDKTIPVYEQGQQFQPTSIEMVEGETSPPPLLTEADLIALMEKHGIGTDATHAEHIETIKNRSYVGVQGDGTFLPGQLGMGLVEGYDLMQFEFSKPKLRAELEADLKRICEGTKVGADVLQEQIVKYRDIFVKAAQEAMKLDQALSSYFGNPEAYTEPAIDPQAQNPQVRLCPRCKTEQMTLRKTSNGNYMIGCLGYPHCKASIFLPKFVLNAEVDESVCRICGPGQVHQLKFTFKRGSVPPMIPLQHVGCVGGCDEMLREILDLKNISSSSMQTGSVQTSRPSQNRGRGGTGRGGTGRGGTGRDGTARGTGRGGGSRRGRGQIMFEQSSNTQPSFNQGRGNFSNHFHDNTQSTPQNNFNNSIGGRGSTWNQSGFGDSGYSSGNSFTSFTSTHGDENSVVCECGSAAATFNVKKDGPNKGRQFYRCSKREGGCGFFLWADEGVAGSSHHNPTTPFNSTGSNWNSSGNSRGNGFNRGSSNSNEPLCNCNQPAARKTVKKDGANHGRPFYGCAKPMGQGCSFFQWADEDGPPAQGRGYGSRGRGAEGRGRGFGRGSGGGGGGGRGGKKRKCGHCRMEGHTKKYCPDNR